MYIRHIDQCIFSILLTVYIQHIYCVVYLSRARPSSDISLQERLDKMSVIDKDPAAKAILELIGRHPHSEGLRDGDMTADSPEDHGIVGTDDHRVISLF